MNKHNNSRPQNHTTQNIFMTTSVVKASIAVISRAKISVPGTDERRRRRPGLGSYAHIQPSSSRRLLTERSRPRRQALSVPPFPPWSPGPLPPRPNASRSRCETARILALPRPHIPHHLLPERRRGNQKPTTESARFGSRPMIVFDPPNVLKQQKYINYQYKIRCT